MPAERQPEGNNNAAQRLIAKLVDDTPRVDAFQPILAADNVLAAFRRDNAPSVGVDNAPRVLLGWHSIDARKPIFSLVPRLVVFVSISKVATAAHDSRVNLNLLLQFINSPLQYD